MVLLVIEALIRINCDGIIKRACPFSHTFVTRLFGDDAALAVARQRAFDDGWGRQYDKHSGRLRDMCPQCHEVQKSDRSGKLAEVEW